MTSRLSLSLLLALPTVAFAQSAVIRQAAESITEADIRRGIEVIAHDSMGGRDTPSAGLDKTAAWVAGEFARIGLRPGGDGGGYLQRYPITVAEPHPDSAFIEFSSGAGAPFKLAFGSDLLLVGAAPSHLTALPMVAVAGPLDTTRVHRDDVDGKLVVWAQPEGAQQANLRRMFGLLNRFGAAGVLIVAPPGAAAAGGPLSPIVRYGRVDLSTPRGSGRFLSIVSVATILRHAPTVAPQVAEMRAATATSVIQLPEWRARVIAKYQMPQVVDAPNVVGILEGADPSLRDEFVVLSAHMDHVGSRCRGGSATDRICNGADDDASGTVGVIELAEAFARPGARPKRSVVFLAVSAEERGLWGSRYFAANAPMGTRAMVANLNMDMIGRNWSDSIVAIGKGHSDLGRMVDRIAATHPELGLTVSDDLWPEENLYRRSDHFNFARRGVPVLFFTSGLHEDYHRVTDSPEKIDAEKQARVLRLVYYLAKEVADRAERPQWNPESFKSIVSGDRP